MAIQTINLGNIVNDGLGDDLRTAFQKVNANFTELNASLTVTASNLGNSGESVFKQKSGTNLEFRRLIAGNKITITSTDDSLLIATTVGDTFQRITTNSGYVDASDHQFVTVQGTGNIVVSAVDEVITIDTSLDLERIATVFDFGPMDGQFDNIPQFNTSFSNVDFGTLSNPGSVNLDLGTFVPEL